MSAQMLKNLIGEFGHSIGIEELALDDENRCNLIFDSIPVSFELSKKEDTIYLYSYLGDLTEVNKAKLYPALMNANYNYLFKGIGEACFGVEAKSGRIGLLREEHLRGVRLEEFNTLVENFVNYAEAFKNKFMNNQAVGAEEEMPEADQQQDTIDPNAMKV